MEESVDERSGGMMKKISIMVPCYNEEDNFVPLSQALIQMFDKVLHKNDIYVDFQ